MLSLLRCPLLFLGYINETLSHGNTCYLVASSIRYKNTWPRSFVTQQKKNNRTLKRSLRKHESRWGDCETLFASDNGQAPSTARNQQGIEWFGNISVHQRIDWYTSWRDNGHLFCGRHSAAMTCNMYTAPSTGAVRSQRSETTRLIFILSSRSKTMTSPCQSRESDHNSTNQKGNVTPSAWKLSSSFAY